MIKPPTQCAIPPENQSQSQIPRDWLHQPAAPLATRIDWQIKEKITFKLFQIQLCEVKTSVMKIGWKTPATSKMEIFVATAEERQLSKIVTNSSVFDVTVVLDNRLIIDIVVSCDNYSAAQNGRKGIIQMLQKKRRSNHEQ